MGREWAKRRGTRGLDLIPRFFVGVRDILNGPEVIWVAAHVGAVWNPPGQR